MRRTISIFQFYRVSSYFRIHRSMNSGGNNKNNSLGLNSYDQQDTSYNTYGLSPSFLASLRIQGPLHNKVFVANVSIIHKQHMLYIPFQPTTNDQPKQSLFSSLCLFYSRSLSLTPSHSLSHSILLSLSLTLARSLWHPSLPSLRPMSGQFILRCFRFVLRAPRCNSCFWFGGL